MSKTPAQRSADYRARKSAEKAATQQQLRADARLHADRDARDALEGSIAAASRWLTASDAGALTQARQLARMIDEAIYRGDDRMVLAASGLYARLLDLLGLTPVKRMQLELRTQKAARVESEAAPSKAPNVTAIRPPKRRGSDRG